MACFVNIDKDARDEGTDYDGDCRVFSFLPKGDKAMKREESNTKLSEVRMLNYFLFLFFVICEGMESACDMCVQTSFC